MAVLCSLSNRGEFCCIYRLWFNFKLVTVGIVGFSRVEVRHKVSFMIELELGCPYQSTGTGRMQLTGWEEWVWV